MKLADFAARVETETHAERLAAFYTAPNLIAGTQKHRRR